MKSNSKEKLYALCLVVLVGISIIPLIILCKYNHPSADDFNYSVTTFCEWNSSHSVWKLLKSAVNTSKSFYDSWQGLYTSAFFLALQPAIFGEKFYALTGILMLSIIIFGTCYFFSFLVKKIIGGSALDGIAIGCVASFLMIQWMPSCVQGLYWYNGAVNYGLFYMVMLLLVCTVINLHKACGKKDNIKAILGCCFLGFWLEGGNHVTAFMGLLFVLGFVLVEIYLKNKSKVICYSFILAFMVACFLFNVMSPGTKVRQDRLNDYGMDAIETIRNAVTGGLRNINSWIDLAPIVAVLLVIPIFLKLIKKVRDNTSFRFKNPFLVFVFSVAWICVMYCPPLYAMGYLGEGRLHNIVYYNFIILFLINIFYCAGWVVSKMDSKNESYVLGISMKWVYCTIVLVIGLLISRWDSTWGAEAVAEMKLGEPQLYSQQAHERNELLLNSGGHDVIVKEYSVRPETLFFDDITEDADDWRNASVRMFYGLNSIIIERQGVE